MCGVLESAIGVLNGDGFFRDLCVLYWCVHSEKMCCTASVGYGHSGDWGRRTCSM